jgi:integrase
VKNIHGLIHRALEDAVEQDLIARNVASLKAARPAKVPRVERGVWAPEELRRFLPVLAADRLAALWHLDCTTGLRRSELLGLPWPALELDAGELAVVQRLIVVDGKPEVRLSTKTPKSARRISIDPATVAMLRAHRKAQAAERLAWGPAWTDTGLVFTLEDGTPLRPRQVARMFERLGAAAGLPALTMHGLRHSYATAGLAAGVPVKVMSERLGHANTAITTCISTCCPRWTLTRPPLLRRGSSARAAPPAAPVRRRRDPGPAMDAERRRNAPALGAFLLVRALCRRGDLNPHVLADTRPSTSEFVPY